MPKRSAHYDDALYCIIGATILIRISLKKISVGALLPALAAILLLSATPQPADAQTLYVGGSSSDQTTSFTSGTSTYVYAYIGYTGTDNNNTLNVLNPGTRLTINGGNVQVGYGGSNNSMVISNGGLVSDVTGVVSFAATAANNSALVTGSGSTWSNSTQVRLGVSGSGTLTVANGGSVIASGANGIQVAVNAGSRGVLNIGSYGGNDSAGSITAPQINFQAGTGYLNFNQTNTFTLTNSIVGATPTAIVFQQLGSGTTILTGTISSANSTVISNGMLQFGDGGASGTTNWAVAKAITNNSVLAINSSTTVTLESANVITGTGSLIQMGTGTTILKQTNNTFSGGTRISAGTLQVGVGDGTSGIVYAGLGTGDVTNNGILAFSGRFTSQPVSNTISGTGALTIVGSQNAIALAGSNSFSGPMTITTDNTLQTGTGGTNGTLGTGSISNAGTLSFNRSNLYTVANTITGSGALRQIGSGTTILTGSISYTGVTTATNGVLQIGDGGTTGSVGGGAITLSGSGKLAFNRADSVTFANAIVGGGGTLSQIGGGTLIVTGSGNTYGATVISSGTLQIGDGGANGSIGTGAVTNNSVLAINSAKTITFASANAMTGTGVLIQMGTGTTILDAATTSYSGGTLISAGILQVGTGVTLDTNGSLGTGNVTNNGTLAFNRTVNSDVVSNNISGTGGLNIMGSGNTTTLAGSNSYSGLTTITAGNGLQTGTGGTNGTLGTGSISNAGTLSFNRSNLYTVANTITGSGALSQIGSGTTILTGSSSYTGGTTISFGTLQIGDGGTTGSIAGYVTNNATLVFNRSDALTHSGAIGGTGAVTKQGAGSLTLTRANSYSGITAISAGTIALSGTGSVGTGGLNLGTTGSPGVFDLSALTAGTYSLPSSASLSGVGTLSGSGKSLAVLGSLSPGNSAGTITVGSGLSLKLSNSGSSVFEITSPAFTAGTFDLVNGDGSVVFGGILNLAFSGGSYANGANVLQVFANTGGRSGNFSAVNYTGLAAGQSATFNQVTGFITIVPEPTTSAIAVFSGAGLAGMTWWRKRRVAESEG